MSHACCSVTCSGRFMTFLLSSRATGKVRPSLRRVAIGRHVGDTVVDNAAKLHTLSRGVGYKNVGFVDTRHVVRIRRAGNKRWPVNIAASRECFVIYSRDPAAVLSQRVVFFLPVPGRRLLQRHSLP